MRRIDRYVLHDEIASGGMGAVHLGQAVGGEGFARIVAIKRMHPHVAASPGAVAGFIDEARLSARVCHPKVVATLDVVDHDRELLLVMEYVHGVTLARLKELVRATGTRLPTEVALAIVVDVLHGLQSVHDATDERGEPLHIVHRDVSPQNVLVGADGVARLLDFGIAKAAARLQDTTQDGRLKGKLGYMSPEQILNESVDSRSDAHAAAVVLWELLTGRPLFDAASEGGVLARILEGVVLGPSKFSPDLPVALDDVVLRALSRRPAERFASCTELAEAIVAVAAPASVDETSRWVRLIAADELREREARIAAIEGALVEPELAASVDASSDATSSDAPTLRMASLAPTLEIPSHEPALVQARASTAASRAMPGDAPTLESRVVPPIDRRPRRLAIAAGLVLAAMLALGGVVLGARAPKAEPLRTIGGDVDATPAVAKAGVPPGAASTIASPDSTGVSPDSIVDDAGTVATPSHAEPDAGTHRAVPRPRPRPPDSSTAPSSPRKTRKGCDPMFTVDEHGIQHVKPQCL